MGFGHQRLTRLAVQWLGKKLLNFLVKSLAAVPNGKRKLECGAFVERIMVMTWNNSISTEQIKPFILRD